MHNAYKKKSLHSLNHNQGCHFKKQVQNLKVPGLAMHAPHLGTWETEVGTWLFKLGGLQRQALSEDKEQMQYSIIIWLVKLTE